ncbi:MAG: hypothetical protein QOJ29_29, partial [Thermoleophilaceae bacterium]|nr:hypothetical protein [Thermoleophilaceae bacterium]
MTRRALAIAVIALAAPCTAHAANVSLYVPPCAPEQSKYGACYSDEARFTAAPGEANKVTITRTVDPPAYQPQVTLKDDGAALEAGAGCKQVDEHTATCTGYNIVAIVNAGDGDDSLSGPGTLMGGPGDDTLSDGSIEQGGPGADHLQAGETGALLQGGDGPDVATGGSGNDTLLDDGTPGEQDTFDGGAGEDVVSYADRSTPVVVSLREPQIGEDRLSAIEDLRGGGGADSLTGDAGPNTIDGGPANDLLSGGEGDDIVAGGTGADTLEGGPGQDKLGPGEDKSHNQLHCGPGIDRADPSVNTLIDSDCEQIGIDDFDLGGIVKLFALRGIRGQLLTMAPAGCVDLPCRITLSV